MKIDECGIEGTRVFDLSKITDNRGTFFEIFRKEWIPEIFDDKVQINCSRSGAGVLRGLHYHKHQWDFWVPVSGSLTAGLVDIRTDSSTYRKSLTLEFDSDEPAGLLIPPGVAHGFAALTDLILIYVVSNYFDNSDEYGIGWNDPGISIKWGIENPIVSARDSVTEPYNWD